MSDKEHIIYMSDERMNEFVDLSRRCGGEDIEDLSAVMQFSATLLRIAVEAIENGKELAILDRDSQTVRTVVLPFADSVKERQKEVEKRASQIHIVK